MRREAIGEEEQKERSGARRNGKGGMRGKSTDGKKKNSRTQSGQKNPLINLNYCSEASYLSFSYEDKNTVFVLFI